ncbi:MAG TPA: MFS transporter [Nocardioidaceae bacterium]|nr:MFS transporter [Nocardioidaceae bacterium]
MTRLAETLAPERLGRSFRWLWASSWASQLGDGFALAAAPLLVASQTHDPFLVAMGATLGHLPWLLFGLFAGVVADRIDRRMVVAVADGCRAVVLLVLTATIVTEQVDIWMVLVAIFLLGTAETFADSAYVTLMPMVVQKPDYGIANARLQSGTLIGNQMAGPPIGAALFAAGMAFPFVAQAVLLVMSALLLFRMKIPVIERTHEPQHVLADIREGLHWLWHHAAVRTLTLTIVSFNVTFGAAWSVLVLYATQRLDLGEVGFGLLTTSMALGGMLGVASYGWLEKHVSLGNIMRAGLILETLTHVALAVTTVPWIALVIFFLFGAHAFIWGTTSSSVRQRAVPTELQGRVGSVYLIGVFGGMVLGGAIGGVVAQIWGVTGPFWFAFVGSALILAVIWPQLRHIAHEDELIRTGEPSAPRS